ncbi:hypothetical protein [Thioalkalivibrio sp. ALE23]|uniref:hypothetical protein n=1 Tax=Thioalkalivibrio sp. ALE23 TaxID=1265495 RepID=UPI00035C2965|nr:hypothetical protein [Thioalkalivibrio sp. ALE23]
MNEESLLPVDRFLQTLEIVRREGEHLDWSRGRLAAESIDAEWVRALGDAPERAERMEAFVSRFGRMQDTIADKLLPRWLLALAETPGSQIEVLNRAERLGVIEDLEDWLEVRRLRNRLVHEYMRDPETFAEDLCRTRAHTDMLLDTYERVRRFAVERMGLDSTAVPVSLAGAE